MRSIVKRSVSLLLAFVIIFSSSGTGLTGVLASAASDTVYKYNGISFTLDDDDNATIVSISGSGGTVDVPETVRKNAFVTKKYTVTAIGDHAISHDAVSVTIPSTVKSIGRDNFANNHMLRSVTFVDSPITSIDDYMFENCHQLNSITLPENLEYIGVHAFGRCFNAQSGRIEIPATVKVIETAAFEGCMNLTEVVLPSYGLTEIGDHAFANCSSLCSISIPTSVTDIGEAAFAGCTNLSNIFLPTYNSLKNVYASSFHETAFYRNESNWVTEPSGAKSLYLNNILLIATGSFGGTYEIGARAENVAIGFSENSPERFSVNPDNISFSTDAAGVLYDRRGTELICYPRYSANESYRIGADVIWIRPEAFSGAGLKSIICENNSSLREIGDRAFGACSALEFVHIPDSVQKIGKNIISDINKTYICSESISNTLQTYASENGITLRTCSGHLNDTAYGHLYYKIVNGNLHITGCKETFEGDLVIPEAIDGYPVVSIEHLTDVQTGNGPRMINSVYIPKTVQNISEGAFSLCTGLNNIVVDPNNPYYSSDENVILFNKDKTVLIHCPAAAQIYNYNIPATVKRIAVGAFSEQQFLNLVYISPSVEVIGQNAFYRCNNLNTVSFESGSLLTEIEGSAFYGSAIQTIDLPDNLSTIKTAAFGECMMLEQVELPERLNVIEANVFKECISLRNIFIPADVSSIGENAFSGCASLETITVDEFNGFYSSYVGILFNKEQTVLLKYPPRVGERYPEEKYFIVPYGVEEIGDYAFDCCPDLLYIEFPDTLKTIGNGAFSNCTGIGEVIIPDSVTDIGSGAFGECGNMKSIKLSENLKALRFGTFSNCASLQSVSLPAGIEEVDASAFIDTHSLEYIHVPAKSGEFRIINTDCISPLVYICSESAGGYAEVFAQELGLEFRLCSGHGDILYVENVERQQEEYYEESYAFYLIKTVGCPQQISFVSQETGDTWVLNRDGKWIDYELTQQGVAGINTYNDLGQEVDTDYDGFVYEDWLVCLSLPEGTYNVITLKKGFPQVWEPVENSYEYTVTYSEAPSILFDANGGYFSLDEVYTQYGLNLKAGDEIAYPEEPYKEGYIFAYWALDGERFSEVVFDGVSKTLEAVWIEETTEKYTVLTYIMNTQGEYELFSSERFEAQNGETVTYTPTPVEGFSVNEEKSILSGKFIAGESLVLEVYIDRDIYTLYFENCDYLPEKYIAGSIVVEPQMPHRAGYYFLGWIDENEKFVEFPFLMPRHDVTLYAVWEPIPYKVTFDADAGLFLDGTSVKTYVVPYGEVIPVPENPTREGYRFIDWDSIIPLKMPDHDLYFNALWDPITYEITFYANGGIFENGEYEITEYYNFGEKVEFPAVYPTENMHADFDCWRDEDYNVLPEEYYMPSRDLCVYAEWKPHTCEITFDANGGAFKNGELQKKYTLTCGEAVPDPGIPELEGYSFDGWSPEPPEYAGEESVTCLAKWKINNYSVTFKANGGAFSDGSEFIIKTVEYGAPIPFPEDPKREGYIFDGWNTEYTVMPAKNLVIDAKWVTDEFTVEWVSVNGYTETHTYDFNEKISIPQAKEKTGFSFAFWSEDPIGIEARIPERMPAKNLKYYAVYEPNEYTLIYRADPGFFADASQEKIFKYLYGSEIKEFKENPTAEGYTFIGWEPEPPKGTMPAEDVDIYAKWEVNKYTVTWVLETDETGKITDSVSEEYEYGEAINPYPTSKRGYRFVGWLDENKNLAPEKMPSRDLVLYPEWEQLEYSVKFYLNENDWNEGRVFEEVYLHFDETIPAPANEETPTTDGYEFIEWRCVTYDAETVVIGDLMPDFNLEFIAEWSPKSYTVRWYVCNEENKQELYEESSYRCGEKIVPPVLEKKGFGYSSWSPEVPEFMPAKDLEFYTNETRKIYMATFLAGKGKFENQTNKVSFEVPFDQEIDVPKDPTREGYSFDGWTPQVPGKMPAEDMTFTATWKPITVNAVFDANGGTFEECPEGAEINEDSDLIIVPTEYDELIIPPAAPKRENYSFGGWTPAVGKMDSTETKTFVAEWVECYYTLVTYTMNTEGEYEKTEKLCDATPGQEIDLSETLAKPEEGLYGETRKSVYKGTVTANNSLVLTLYFARNKYELTFDAGAGIFDDGKQIRTEYFYHGSIMPEYVPYRTGYEFVRWVPETPETEITETVLKAEKYTAEWEIVNYTITWDFADERENQVDTYEFGQEILEVDIPKNSMAPEGLYYAWIEVHQEIDVPQHMPDCDLEFIEVLFAIPCYAEFYAGEGCFSDNTSESKVKGEFGQEIPLPENPVREGYTFLGWREELVNVLYPAGESVGYFTIGTRVFTAEWEISSYTVTFHANGGTFADGGESVEYVVEYNDPIPEPEDVWRDYYDIEDWVCVTKGYENLKIGDPMPAVDLDFVAGWTIHTYPAIFDANGGKFPDGTTVKAFQVAFGEVIPIPESPVRKGYIFAGWSPLPDIMDSSEKSFLAQWELDPDAETASYVTETYVMDLDGDYYQANRIVLTGVVGETVSITPDPGTGFSVGEESVLSGIVEADGSLVLKVYYERNKYVLHGIINGIEEITEEYYYEAQVNEPKVRHYEGYYFVGWVDEQGEYVDFPFPMPAEDVFIYADFPDQWHPVLIEIEWISEGRLFDRTVERFHDPITEPASVPYKKGYTFIEWLCTTDSRIKVGYSAPPYDLEFEAQFDPNPVTVIFYGEDNEEIMRTETRCDAPISPPENYEKTGYTLKWEDSDGNRLPATVPCIDFAEGETEIILKYYAKYDVNIHKVKWIDGNTQKIEEYAYNSVIKEYVKEKTGYSLNWTDEEGNTVTFTDTTPVMPDEDVTYYAKWNVNTYNAVFNANGGTFSVCPEGAEINESKDVITVPTVYNEKIVAPDSPVRNGYKFDGWAPSVGRMDVADDKEFKAEWKKLYKLEINYITLDGTVIAPKYSKMLEGGIKYLVPNPSVTGYTCDSLYVELTLTEDTVINVYYIANTHEISFFIKTPDELLNEELHSYTYSYGDEIEMSIFPPSYNGYAFSGFEDEYGNEVEIPETMPDNDILVYVCYYAKLYSLKIDYVYSDGTQAAESFVDTVAFGEEYSYPSPEVTGYKPNFEYVTGKMPAKSVTHRVTYTVNGYNVYIKYNDETVETLAFDYGEEIVLDFNIPDIEGYTYSGTSEYPETMPAHDVTVYLEYTKNSYMLDIKYQYPDKTQAADPVSQTVPYGEEYSIDSPKIEGFIPDIERVSGKMGAKNVSVTVTYYDLATVTYDANGASGKVPTQPDVARGKEITVQGAGDLYKIYSEDIDGGARLPIDVILLLDSSGSMTGNDPEDIRLNAAREYVETLTEIDRAAVIDFDSYASVLCEFTDSKQDIFSAIDKINSDGGTMISNGMTTAISQFENAENPAGEADKIIILLTDGQSSYDTSISLVAKKKGITVYTIGLGNNVEEKLLKEIAETTGGQYFWIDKATDLPALFELISKKTVTVRYEFAGWLASDERGELGVYEEGDKLEVNSDTVLSAIWIEPDEMYIAEWVFGSKCRKQIYYANEKPVYNGPESISENGNRLTLSGWDINGDGIADYGPFDEMPPITERTKYTAVYNSEKEIINEIKLSAESLMLFVGEVAELLEGFVPETADKNDIIWSSDDSSVASVDENGTVTAKIPGSVIIRAETVDGTVAETCRVTVVESQIVSLEINTLPEKLEYYVGDKLDTKGMTLKAVYDDGETIIIEDGFTCSPTILNVEGKRRITVDYSGATCYFEVVVFKRSYDVTYTVDETEYAKYTVVEDDEVPVPDVPRKTGHTFDGWCDENGQAVEIPDKMPGNELHFYAKWKVNRYTAKWYSEGKLFDQKEYFYGETIASASSPEKEGHTFMGWTPDVPDTMPAEDKIFYALFNANTYNAEFFANGGVFADGSEKVTVETTYNTAISVPDAPEKQGYVFAGWGVSVPDAMPAEDLAFTASWISADDTAYIIELYYMDTTGQYGTTPDSTVAREGITDENVTADYSVPEGFTVDGAKSVLNGTVSADGSLVLKVYFKRNLYSLTTVVDGKTETSEYLYGSILTAPATPSKESHRFVEWQNENGETFDFSEFTKMPAYDITVTAVFEISKHTVKYFVESREYAVYEVEVGAEIPVPQNPIFFLTKVFVRWDPEVGSVMPDEDLVYNAVIHTHAYEETATREPTCTEKGEVIEKCSCGKTTKKSMDALGHSWGAWQVVKAATQYENGVTMRTCSRCGAYDYEDLPARNANFTVRPIEDQIFNSFISSRPSVEVYSLDGTKLSPLFHYRKEYRNNDEVGTASVFVTGRGKYYGQVRVDFNIVERRADDFIITFPTVLYPDTVETTDPVVICDGTVLTNGEDYTVEYITDENGDITSAVITGKGNYDGTKTVEIKTVEKTVLFTASVIPEQEFTGEAIKPVFNVYDGEKVLRENTDYTVEYSDNTDVGFGEIVVTGTGDYSGTLTLPFRIKGTDASKLDVPDLPDIVYGEGELTPDFKANPITYNGKELTEGVDFDYYVDNADSVGTAEIVIVGKGNFSGRTVIYVNIKSPAINSAEIVLPADTLGYDKTMKLAVVTTPDYTSAENVTWTTSDKRIATVDEDGNVKAVGRGKVKITATVTDEHGNTVSTSVEITCTMTFWQRIVAFFRKLFGIG